MNSTSSSAQLSPACPCLPLPLAVARQSGLQRESSPVRASVCKRRWVRARLRDPLSLHSHLCPSLSEHARPALLEALEVPRAWHDTILGTNGEKPQHTAALALIAAIHARPKFSAGEQPRHRLFLCPSRSGPREGCRL
jgi:hypothetical protein